MSSALLTDVGNHIFATKRNCIWSIKSVIFLKWPWKWQ